MALLPAFKDLELNPDPNAAPIETSEPPTLAEESENQPEPPAIVGEVNTTALTASTATEESENQTETPPNRIAINILGPMYDQLNPDLISHMSTSITDLPHLLGFCPNYINLIHEFLEVVNLLKILKTQKPSTAIRLSQLETENMEIILEEAKAKELDHSEFSTLLESLHTKITTPNLVFEEILETGKGVLAALQKHFSPEFLNRFTGLIVFKALTKSIKGKLAKIIPTIIIISIARLL